MSMGQVMMIPKTKPLYTRERANNMYSASAYFLATWLTATLNFIFYPLITSSISFAFLKFQDHSFENYLRWIEILVIQALSGSSFGFMFGCLDLDDMAALILNQFAITTFNFGSGMFANNGTNNIFVKFLSWISPFRYASESMMRTMLRGKENVSFIYDIYKYNFG